MPEQRAIVIVVAFVVCMCSICSPTAIVLTFSASTAIAFDLFAGFVVVHALTTHHYMAYKAAISNFNEIIITHTYTRAVL